MRSSTKTWLAVGAWWLLTGGVWTGQAISMFAAAGTPVDGAALLRMEMASALLWIPITMALFAAVRRWPVEAGAVRRALAIHAGAVAAVILVRAAAVLALNPLVGWYAQLPSLPGLLGTSVLNNLLLSWMIIGVAHALVYAEREARRRQQAQQLETQLAQARLHALAGQLNPHFLFNALNSIAEVVHRDAEAADDMLTSLGELLRASLDSERTQETSLAEEIAFLEHYVGIERVRLGARLRFDCQVAVETLGARVPHLLLQPLVENAIRHAVAPRPAPGRVSVRARACNGRLLLEVQDDGDGRGDPAASGAGVGLRSTRARLQGLFGADHAFELAHPPEGGTLARVDVPLQAHRAAA
jgi:two-component sensor histidine kinase